MCVVKRKNRCSVSDSKSHHRRVLAPRCTTLLPMFLSRRQARLISRPAGSKHEKHFSFPISYSNTILCVCVCVYECMCVLINIIYYNNYILYIIILINIILLLSPIKKLYNYIYNYVYKIIYFIYN